MSSIKFEDFSLDVKNIIDSETIKWLYEVVSEIESRTKRNTRFDTGQLKEKWNSVVIEDKKEAVVGNPLENAIWEEFGTGEYALKGNGRKSGWVYKDFKGKWKYTRGKTPSRAFQKSYNSIKEKAKQELQRRIKNLG